MVFRILPPEFRAKARAEGPSGNRALHEPRIQRGGNPVSSRPGLAESAPAQLSPVQPEDLNMFHPECVGSNAEQA